MGGDAPIRDKKMSLSKKKEAFLKYELYVTLSLANPGLYLCLVFLIACTKILIVVFQFDRLAESVDQCVVKESPHCCY